MLNERLVAHRGFQKNYPENTLLALTRAIEAGAHFIEMDIQFTADGHGVVYHDLFLKRVSNREGSVNQLSLEQAISYPAYEPARLGEQFLEETITALTAITELLRKNPSVTAFIELKNEAIALQGIEKSYRIIEQCLKPVAGQCILISFNVEFIAYAKQQNLFAIGIVATNWEDITNNDYKQIQPSYVFCDKLIIPDKADLDSLPFYLVVYEIADAKEAREWFSRGADLIETFDIGSVITALGHQAL